MTFALWTACACVATFAVAAGLASLAVWPAAGAAGEALARDPGRAARRLLVLRLLPAIVGLVLAAAVTLPAFLLFEPRHGGETAGWTFSLIAIGGGLTLARGVARGVGDWWASRRLRRAWMRQGRPLALADAPVPAFRIRHEFPVVSIVGILRPRLFVAEQVLDRLSPAELHAVLAHEAGHVRSADNLKRLLVRLCPALPSRAAARGLEERWEQAAEEAADARAESAVDLASALVKTARLAPVGTRIEMPMASFQKGQSLARRVRRLTATSGWPAMAEAAPVRSRLGVALTAAAAVTAAAALWPPLLAVAHRLVEAVVHLP